MNAFSTRYLLVATAAIIAGNAIHRWLVAPTLQSLKLL
jgi:hypothetical protein